MQVKKTKLNDCYYFNLNIFYDKRGFFNEILHKNKYFKFIKKKLFKQIFLIQRKMFLEEYTFKPRRHRGNY